MLLWYQAKPSCKLTAIFEAGLIANRSDQGRGGNRPDPLDLANALAHFIGTEEAFDPLIVASETRV